MQAKRRLVKSPPELWTELSDAAALARHLGEFGEIRITRLDPETKVVWEGDRANGSVELESAGWGTQVTFTVELEETEAVGPEPEPEPEPVVEAPPRAPAPTPRVAPRRSGFFSRLFGWEDRVETVIEAARETVAVEPEPEPVPEPEPEPEADETVQLLENVLDQLGQAHHRPFSRA